MFTGLIEETGIVRRIVRSTVSASLTVAAPLVCTGTKTGDSIAVNGVCLTVTAVSPDVFSADIMAETLSRSSLGNLRVGSKVNLERALAAGGRLGGHLVSGHIDGTGTITAAVRDGIAVRYTVACAPELLKYIPLKASVALDGISLTVCGTDSGSFTVSVIPHTAAHTVLGGKKAGDCVNIECDMIAKYLEKLI